MALSSPTAEKERSFSALAVKRALIRGRALMGLTGTVVGTGKK